MHAAAVIKFSPCEVRAPPRPSGDSEGTRHSPPAKSHLASPQAALQRLVSLNFLSDQPAGDRVHPCVGAEETEAPGCPDGTQAPVCLALTLKSIFLPLERKSQCLAHRPSCLGPCNPTPHMGMLHMCLSTPRKDSVRLKRHRHSKKNLHARRPKPALDNS